jgi:ATP-binding cassette subfamily B protein
MFKNPRLLSIMKFLGRKALGLFFVAVAVGVLWFLSEASFVFVLQTFLVNIGLFQKDQTFLPDWLKGNTEYAMLLLLLFGCFRAAVQFSRTYVSGVANQSFVRHQRSQILEWALLGKINYSSHQLASIFNETVTHSGIFLMRATEFVISGTSFVFFFVMGLSLAPYELLIAMALLSIFVLPLKIFDKKIHKSGEGLREEYAKVNRTLLQVLKNRLFLDLSGQTRQHVESGKKNLERYEAHYEMFYKIYGLKAVLPNLVGVAVIAVVTLLSLHYFKTPPIKLLGFFYIFIRLAQSASDASGTLSDFRLHRPAFQQLRQMSETHQNEVSRIEEPGKKDLLEVQSLELKDVSFSYDSKTPVIKDLSFKLNKGETLLISGPSGSGKSTVTQLISLLLEPHSGEVLLNGANAKNVNVYKQISYAGPDPFLIDGSLRENLLFGSAQKHSDEELVKACQAAEIWSLIDTLPGGLDFVLDESAQLSTGQKQRIAIARAILKDSPLLIFDEATSNIDYEIEKKIMNNLFGNRQQRISIFISHRDTLREFVTREIKLEA